MRSPHTALLVASIFFGGSTAAAGPVEPSQDAARWPSDWTQNWRANDGQRLDVYQVENVNGTVAVPAAAVASLCGDFDGCTIRVIERYFSGDTACPGGVGDHDSRLFTDQSALSWYLSEESFSRQGTHGNILPEHIFFQESVTAPNAYVWSFSDDYIPPGTFDLSYGFECHDSLVIQCYHYRVCALRIED